MPNQAKANLSALIESTEDLIWSVDLDYRLIAFNSALQKHIESTFGIRPAVGMHPEDLVPPERASLMPPLYDRARTEGSYRVEFSLVDGRILELALNPIVADGETTGISVFGKDITERNAAESALKEAEKKYRAIFDGALEGIFQTALDGTPLAANPALARMLGYESPREMLSLIKNVGQDIWVDSDERYRYIQRIKENGDVAVLGYECRFKRKDGSVIWVSLNGRLVRNTDGDPLHYEGFITDVTERKRAEESLRESGDILNEAQLLGSLGFYVLDIPSGVWTSSDVMDGIFGIDKQYAHTIEGWAALIHPLDRDLMAAYFQNEVVAKRQQFDKEYRIIRHKDQAERWVHGTGRLEYDAQGQPFRMHGIIRDITERKLTEAHLRDSEESYRSTFEQVAVGIVHATFDGRILRYNSRFAAILGYNGGEIIGFNVQQITEPEDRAASREAMQRILDGATVKESLEKRYLRRDGSPTWVKLTLSIQRDGEGRALQFIAVVEDINDRKNAEQNLVDAANALRASEARYRTVFLMNIDSVDICHMEDGKFIDVNDAFLANMGYEREDVIGRTAIELGIWVNPGDRKILIDEIQKNLTCRNLEVQYRVKDGTLRWGLLSVSTIELDGIPCILSVTRDITDAKAAEQRLEAAQDALRASEERYRTTFQMSIDAININRLSDGVFVDVNEAFLQFVGFERREVIGRTSQELNFWVDPEDRQRMIDALRQSASCRDLEARFRKKNGDIVWGQLSESIIETDGVPCILSVTRDISAAKAAEEQIRDLAFYDPLTHLPNRRLLMDRLRQALVSSSRSNRKRALLFVDLDNFKILNDTLGHQTGDLMLQEVALRLSACIREADTVARLGGDEFVVMLADLSDIPEEAAAQAEMVGEKILTAVNQPFWLTGRECLSTSSIGITVFGDKRESTDDVLQQADIAMYQAKAAGRNTMRFFAPALQAAVNARVALEEDIRQAIKTSQFVLYYQPQLDSIGLVGAEALIRWNHPRRGLLLPGEFIHLAEETGLIQPLGDWVLENACAQIAAWAERTETAHLSLAVNISARQFRQPGFVDKVLSALERTGANPQNVKLELTESMLVDNIEDVIAKMTLLKSHGLKFSLDDFGTGYSSLAYLKRLPLDQLKIDSSFVRDILADVGSRAIAQSVISLGRALGLSVIAECVETKEQRDLLNRLGCHAFQGFLFSKPLPLEVFEKLWLTSASYNIPVAG